MTAAGSQRKFHAGFYLLWPRLFLDVLPVCCGCTSQSSDPPSSLFVVTASGLEGSHKLPDDAYRTFHRDLQKCVFVIGIDLGGT